MNPLADQKTNHVRRIILWSESIECYNEFQETMINPKKRKHTIVGQLGSLTKRVCIEVQDLKVNEKNEPSKKDDSLQFTEHKRCYPTKFVSFMYKLHLSILCLLRKSLCDHIYASLTISFEDEEIEKFKDIVIRHQQKSIHIRIVDDHFIGYDITYSKLFTDYQTFSLNALFNSFVKYFVYKPFKFLKTVEHLVIYTNLRLDISKNYELNYDRKKEFYPFRFERISFAEPSILLNILMSESSSMNNGCYRFTQDKVTKEKFFERLKLTYAMQKSVNDRKLPDTFVDKVKEKFFNKLVFVTNQPEREKLKTIINFELSKTNLSFSRLEERVLSFIHPRPLFMYEFNLLISVVHDILVQNSICLNYEINDAFSYISVKYRNKVTFIKVFFESRKISHNQLFPPANQEWRSNMILNKQFVHFIKEFRRNGNIKFFIIYTNAQLDLTNENSLKGLHLKDPIWFQSIDVSHRRFKIFNQLNGIIKKSLYQITPNESVFKLLNANGDKSEPLTCQQILEMKKTFLHKLIFATNQPSEKKIRGIIEDEIHSRDHEFLHFHDYEVLQEIALRWIESYKLGSITEKIAKQIYYDIENNISTFQKLRRRNIAAEIKFTNTVIGREGSSIFNNFLQYIVAGKGKNYLEDFRKSGLGLNSVSGILHGARSQAVVALEKLHEIWYDERGKESSYLETLRKNRLKLRTLSSFLNEAGPCAPEAFRNLFLVWFDEQGNKTRYLSTLEKEKISLIHFSSMLNGGGRDAAVGFKNLFDLLFDEQGNKTKYLKFLEEIGLHLVNFSTILSCAGRRAAEAFRDLYDVFFYSDGGKTSYLKVLEDNGINLNSFCTLLNRSGSNAGENFKSVFHLFFDDNGKKTHYLTNMEKENISLLHLNSVLNGARSNFLRAFKDLYNVWFDEQGNKTQYLKVLKNNNIDLHRMTTILFGSGSRAAQAFKNLYNLLFDENGQKSIYLQTLLRNGYSLTTMGYMLQGTKTNASHAYKILHHILFDDEGNKSECLKNLEREGISLSSVSAFLRTAKSEIESAFHDLYNLWFDENASKTRYSQILENNGLTMSRMSAILHGSGCDAAKAYKDLFECWFNDDNSKTKYLTVFEQNGFNLPKVGTLLYRAGKNSSQIFMDIYNLWFDEEGNKNVEVKLFENEGISLLKLKTLFRGLGSQIVICFNNFFDLWFHKDGTLTHFYSTWKKNRIDLTRLLTIFKTLRPNSLEVMKELYHIWFTPEGEKTQYSLILETNGVKLFQMVDILRKTNDQAPRVSVDLYNLWFDRMGCKTQHLMDVEKKGMSLTDIAGVLAGAGKNAVDKFMDM